MHEQTPTILDNTAEVGREVCMWVCTSETGYTNRIKMYNSVVSNFDSSEVR